MEGLMRCVECGNTDLALNAKSYDWNLKFFRCKKCVLRTKKRIRDYFHKIALGQQNECKADKL